MLGVVIWLLGVYGGVGEETARITAFGGFLLIVAVACMRSMGWEARRTITWALIALLVSRWFLPLPMASLGDHIAWEPWSKERAADATTNGQAVFVDFTRHLVSSLIAMP